MNTAMSATPFPRPDYRAKKHPRPIKWTRQAVRQQCELAVARELGVRV